MEAVLAAKFDHPDMKKLLLETGDAFLLEHNDRPGRSRVKIC